MEDNRNKWGTENVKSSEATELQQKIESLKDEKKKLAQELNAAKARERLLKTQLQDGKAHMAILVKLAHQTTLEIKPPRSLTREAIKKRYAALAAQQGLDSTPSEYVELFRNAMPKEYINQGGAPTQTSPKPNAVES